MYLKNANGRHFFRQKPSEPDCNRPSKCSLTLKKPAVLVIDLQCTFPTHVYKSILYQHSIKLCIKLVTVADVAACAGCNYMYYQKGFGR